MSFENRIWMIIASYIPIIESDVAKKWVPGWRSGPTRQSFGQLTIRALLEN